MSDKTRSSPPPRVKPIIKQCSFQRNNSAKVRFEDHVNKDTKPDPPHRKKKTLTETLPDVVAKFRAELRCKSFVLKTKQSVEKKNRLERPWIKGNEMGAFYHTWQTSEDHVTDQTVRPSTLRRGNSIPRNFRFSEFSTDDPKSRPKTASSDFGIVRECCSHPRMRIPTFLHEH